MIRFISITCLLIAFSACAQQNKKVASTSSVKMESDNTIIDTIWTEKVVKSDAEWKKSLTTKQYYILREHGTERPFSSALYEIKEEGTYICAGCKNPLFSSNAKFDSGTGWPSYFQPYSKKSINVAADNSLGMERNALTYQRCDGHLGHVFNDGNEPTGLRYCIDRDGMLFVPKKAQVSCFWCTETIFESIKGVSEVISRYSGGKETTLTYESLGGCRTSHVEAFQIYYHPNVISYKDLVRVFFASIDLTIVNGQGPDRGEQYRTSAFYSNDEEKAIIETKIAEIAKEYSKPIATQVVKYDKFYEAEEYHQDFVKRNPNQGYVGAESIPRRERTLAKVKDLVK